jgi:hypothetical protein
LQRKAIYAEARLWTHIEDSIGGAQAEQAETRERTAGRDRGLNCTEAVESRQARIGAVAEVETLLGIWMRHTIQL